MRQRILFILVIIFILLVGFNLYRRMGSAMTADSAIALVKKTYPGYDDYPSDNLPPKTIETTETKEGWRVGMYIEGSGVKGILTAHCFLVTREGVVSQTGMFNGEGPAVSINLATCTPKD